MGVSDWQKSYHHNLMSRHNLLQYVSTICDRPIFPGRFLSPQHWATMKIRLSLADDDDDEYDAPSVYGRTPWGSEDARSSMDPFDPRFGPRGKPRLRAPSDDDTSDSSDVGSDFGGDDTRESATFGLFQQAEAVPTLSAVSRQGAFGCILGLRPRGVPLCL
jgi:hypothetical protein